MKMRLFVCLFNHVLIREAEFWVGRNEQLGKVEEKKMAVSIYNADGQMGKLLEKGRRFVSGGVVWHINVFNFHFDTM